jgi:succinoglycan biosynthesis protein ExoM
MTSEQLAGRRQGGDDAASVVRHITVCICAYRRPRLLDRALANCSNLKTEGLFRYSITVVDNDHSESSRPVVTRYARSGRVPIDYDVEPQQNIALARNRAVANARGDLIAFVDDDEFPETDWLLRLYHTYQLYDVDAVLGPVIPYFEAQPPEWVLRERCFERPRHRTGTVLQWKSTRTGNVLLNADVVRSCPEPFRPELGGGGEDRDFFRRMIERGRRVIWCDEAIVHEFVPAHRWSRRFMIRRALHRGQQAVANPDHTKLSTMRSVVALMVYCGLLPFLLVSGRHRFMTYLTKCCDHLGKCLAAIGITVIKDKYVVG